MMTAQMSRTPVTSWSTLFPAEQNTVAQSALFVKKLLAVGLSSITYLRTLFPEGAYSDRDLDGLKLKMLQDNSDCQGANTLISWIKSAFQALDKQYLRQLTLTLHTDPKEYEKAIESYTYKISYSNDKEAFISELLTKIDAIEKKYDVRRSTQKMLRTVLLLTQSLKPLPSKVFLTMQLHYYDDVTPPEYEPVGFKPATPPDSHSLGDPVTIKVGDVCTPFHTVKLRVTVNKAVYSDDKEENEQQNMAITEDKENPQAGNEQAESSGLENPENPLPSSDSVIIRCHKRSKKHFADLVPQCQKPQESLPPKNDSASSMYFGQDKHDSTGANPQLRSESNPQDDCVPSITPVSKSCSVAQVVSIGSGEEVQIVPEVEPKEDQDRCTSIRRSRRLLSLPSAVTPPASASGLSDTSSMKDDEEPVRCECGVHHDDGLMILCDICKTWQHALCFKLSKKDEVPERHVCLQCSVTSGLPCTDSSFRDMTKEEVQRICLLRRALEFLRGYYARVTVPKLGQRLGVDISQAQKLMGHLEAMMIFRDGGKRRHRVVNKKKVKRAYSKYFGSQQVLMEEEFEDTQVLQTPEQGHQEVGSDSDMTPDLRQPMQVLDSEMGSSHDIPAPDSQATQVVADPDSQRTTQFMKEPQGEGLFYTQEGEVVDSTQDVPVGTQKIITLGTGFDETFSCYNPVNASQVFATAGNTVATLEEEVEEMTNICSNPVDSTTAADTGTTQVSTSHCNETSMANKYVTEPVNTSQEQIAEHPEKSAALVFESADIRELPGSSNLEEHQSQVNAEALQEVACRSVELHIENPTSRRALMTRSNRLSRNKAKQPVTMNLNDYEISSSQGSPTPEHQWKGKRAKIL
ncbi:uncharacterized protein LOC125044788 isoform X2 [Penaeus chinensis]|uniref:uncharacterized protein LOC125044788 isoform X2 n=1 Tax=Penaeus chinensis TaxID=139456 RepID=UPI001FB64D95|nr:uncharacterized protein LOC125044788 isoform X2 [Penaeus chinensis]